MAYSDSGDNSTALRPRPVQQQPLAVLSANPTSYAPTSWHIRMQGVDSFWEDSAASVDAMWQAIKEIGRRTGFAVHEHEFDGELTCIPPNYCDLARTQISAVRRKLNVDLPSEYIRLLHYLGRKQGSAEDDAYKAYTGKSRIDVVLSKLNSMLVKYKKRAEVFENLFGNTKHESIYAEMTSTQEHVPRVKEYVSNEDRQQLRVLARALAERKQALQSLAEPQFPFPVENAIAKAPVTNAIVDAATAQARSTQLQQLHKLQ